MHLSDLLHPLVFTVSALVANMTGMDINYQIISVLSLTKFIFMP